jgi:hypothetical protein
MSDSDASFANLLWTMGDVMSDDRANGNGRSSKPGTKEGLERREVLLGSTALLASSALTAVVGPVQAQEVQPAQAPQPVPMARSQYKLGEVLPTCPGLV